MIHGDDETTQDGFAETTIYRQEIQEFDKVNDDIEIENGNEDEEDNHEDDNEEDMYEDDDEMNVKITRKIGCGDAALSDNVTDGVWYDNENIQEGNTASPGDV